MTVNPVMTIATSILATGRRAERKGSLVETKKAREDGGGGGLLHRDVLAMRPRIEKCARWSPPAAMAECGLGCSVRLPSCSGIALQQARRGGAGDSGLSTRARMRVPGAGCRIAWSHPVRRKNVRPARVL